MDYHFIRERVLRKEIDVQHIPTVDRVADVFTKGLSTKRFQTLKSKVKVQEKPISLRGPGSDTQD